MKIKISADSTCDLPEALLEEHNIGITPLYIVKNGASYRDGIDITPPDIFEYVGGTGNACSTAAVSVQDYIDTWSEWKKDCDAIVHIGFSSALSATCNNAAIAAKVVGDVYVADALNLSVGHGTLVLDAAELAAAGCAPEEITAEISRRAPLVDMSFVIDTLHYLAKGGRCSTVTALGANVLSLKPCIEVRGGGMGVAKKYRGKIERVYHEYIRDRLGNGGEIDTRRIFVVDSGLDEETRAGLVQTVRDALPFEQVILARAGCTISNHCGPKTLGLMYMRKG